MNDDLRELLNLLKFHEVKFLVVGAHAVAFHSRPRMTEDFDVWVARSLKNSEKLARALAQFGTPIGDDGAIRFAEQDRQIVRIGVPPNMVDILNFAGSHPFEEVYSRRIQGEMEGIELQFPCVEDLIDMKRVAGRKKDIADIEALGG